MSNILKGILNEGAYQDGVRDGMQGQANPRASSIYGPESSEYQRGYEDGLVKGKDQKQANIDSYNAKLAPYKDIPTEELKQMLRNIRKRSDEIQAIFNKYKGASLFGGDAPPNTEELRAEGKKNNEAWQAIHQELFQRGVSNDRRMEESVIDEAVDESWIQAYKALEANGGEPDVTKPTLFVKQLAMLAKDAGIDSYYLLDFVENYISDKAKSWSTAKLVREAMKQAPSITDIKKYSQQSQAADTSFAQQQDIGRLQHELSAQQLVNQNKLETADAEQLVQMDANARFAIQAKRQELALDAKERLHKLQMEIDATAERKEIRDHELKMAQAGYDHEINVINVRAEGEYKKAKLEADYQIKIKELENIDNAGERQNKLDQINADKAKQIAIIDAETNAKVRVLQKEVDVERQQNDIAIEKAYMMSFNPIWGAALTAAHAAGATWDAGIKNLNKALKMLASPIMPKAQKVKEDGSMESMPEFYAGQEIMWRPKFAKMIMVPSTVVAAAPGKLKIKLHSPRMIQNYGKEVIVVGLDKIDVMPKQSVAEGEEISTFAALKDWRVWDVHVFNNFYRGKYADYGPRLYSVVASSPEEARQVVIDNPDYVLQDLLSRKLQSGKRVLPRGSALPIEAKRVGKAEPGTITTMAFKKMLTPDGVQSFKFTNGKIVDGAHVQGGEEQNMTEGQDIDVNVVVGKLYDIIDHAEDSIKNADYDRQAQYATTVRDRAVKALNMIKQGGNTPESASAAFRYFQSGEQGVAEGLEHSKRQQLIKFLAKKMGWEHSYLELASDANLISWYKKVQAGKDPMKENKSEEADYGDDYQNMVQRVGQKAKEQEKKKPVDIQALARRLNQPEKKSNILKGIEENLGTPYPSTYEEENKPFKKKGAYRITAMTSESKKK